MSKDARHHHYIPQCYLRGFTSSGGKKSKLTVAVLRERRFFETTPRNVCGVRDFNRIDSNLAKPDAIEGVFADFETKVARAIRRVAESASFTGEDRTTILNLIALLAVRSPQMREHWRKFEDKIARHVLDLTLASRDRWESTVRNMEADGEVFPHKVSYESVKQFHESGEYQMTIPTERQIDLELHGMDAVLPCLIDRKWALLTSDDSTGLFISTDRPVDLTWKDPDRVSQLMLNNPGFGLVDTEVLFPLTRHLALVGDFDGREGTIRATPKLVATANTRMFMRAFEQAYASKASFPYLGPDGRVATDRLPFRLLDV